MRRVATLAKKMSPRATTQLTTMELVIGKPKTRPTSRAFADKPCAPGAEGTATMVCSTAGLDTGDVV